MTDESKVETVDYLAGNPLFSSKGIALDSNMIISICITVFMFLLVLSVIRNTNKTFSCTERLTKNFGSMASKIVEKEKFMSNKHDPSIFTYPIYTKIEEKRMYGAISTLSKINETREAEGQPPLSWDEWWIKYKKDNPLEGDIVEKFTEKSLNPY